jgi:hypothetical protein
MKNGPTMKLNPAAILLQDYLEIMSLCSGLSTFNPAPFEHNPPRYYRLKRIQACLKALDIQVQTVHDFKIGDWCHRIGDEQVKTIEKVLERSFQLDYASYIKNKNSFSAAYIFYMLLHTREIMSKFKYLNECVLAASGHFQTPVRILNQLQEKQEPQRMAIDEVLQRMMNPNELILSKKELRQQYGFPTVDLDAIDLDWI